MISLLSAQVRNLIALSQLPDFHSGMRREVEPRFLLPVLLELCLLRARGHDALACRGCVAS
jgi:hypothetical protein